MRKSKHTSGKLSVALSDRGLELECEDGSTMAVMDEWTQAAEQESNVARLALCWNSHDELVAALKRIADAKADGLDGARDTAVLERAIALANRTLAKLSPT